MQTNRKSGKTLLAMLILGVLGVLTITGLKRMMQPPSPEPKPARPVQEMPVRLFRGWPKPDLALMLSAEQHGYLLPCGCSRPQVGGLERRHNFLELLRSKDWPVAAVDVGDIPQSHGPAQLQNRQGLIKYRYSMEALKKMGYLAVSLGEYESRLSLFDLLAEFALNSETPAVLAANLSKRDELYPGQVKPLVVENVKGTKLKVGVAGLIGPTVGAKLKKDRVELDDERQTAAQLVRDLAAQKTDLNVLLYQGSLREAKALVESQRQFHVVLCLSDTDEPSSEPVRVGGSIVVAPGHKGKYVGVAGVWSTGQADKPFEYRYELVSLGEEFLTPEEKRDEQPVTKLMEQYARELKSQNYLGQYAAMKHPSQVAIPGAVPTYVGSDKCKKCHDDAYDVWQKSKHAHAFESLEQAKRPGLRHHDAECIVCHTVGFGYESGYRGEKETAHLKNVGCESCHGPGSEHVKLPKDERWYAVMNPWKPTAGETKKQKDERLLRVNDFCRNCHDADNDVHYDFDKRWPPISHPSP